MNSSYLNAGCSSSTLRRGLAPLLLSVLCATPVFAKDYAVTPTDNAPAFKSYSAEYLTKTRGISLTLERKLSQTADGSYSLSNGGSKLIAGFEENSKFKVENNRIIPGSYVYQGTGLMNRRREVHFTPGATTVRSLYKEKWYELPYTENTFDRMSQQEQVRLALMQAENPQSSVTVTVADGKRVKDYRLDFVAKETLKTPMGIIDVLHFERRHDDPDRKSDTWLAPGWDYLMVKTVHVEDGTPVEVNITSVKMAGTELRGE